MNMPRLVGQFYLAQPTPGVGVLYGVDWNVMYVYYFIVCSVYFCQKESTLLLVIHLFLENIDAYQGASASTRSYPGASARLCSFPDAVRLAQFEHILSFY